MISQSCQSVIFVLFFILTSSLATEYADTLSKDIEDNADTLLHKLRSQRMHGSSLLLNRVGDGLLKQDATRFLNQLEDDLLNKQEVQMKPNTSICGCFKFSCGCCVYLKWKKVHLNDTVCANFTYLPAPEYGISLTLSLDGKAIINKTVSASNPPPICAGIPYLEKIASLCLRFYDIAFTNRTLSACMELEARIEMVKVEKLKLGCFKIPPSKGLKDAGTNGLHVLKPGVELAGPKEMKHVASVGVELTGPKELMHVLSKGLKYVASNPAELSGQKEDNYDPDKLYFKSMKEVFGNN